ncbi:cfs1-like protein [Datura stramonium]|uniref:Cfs1-like protein n=1 Tax=Datura stramonium TaxID=4076 RepID=A0ABS8TFV1_DATST|nr:cfs1-like protein [Datura stramonium]
MDCLAWDVISYLEAVDNNLDIDRNETLEQFIKSHGYSELFQKHLIPICASIWPCPLAGVLGFSAYYILLFCRDHHLLQEKAPISYILLPSHSYELLVIPSVKEKALAGCTIACNDGAKEVYDRCIIAANASDTLTMLGKEATYDESRILGAFQYVYSDTFLHRDKTFLPRNPGAWSACNFVGTMNDRACVTYWLNIIQVILVTQSCLISRNPRSSSEARGITLLKWRTSHPVPSVAASKASCELHQIQGKRGIWFCGVYQGYGFHEDGLKAGMVAADGMLRRNCSILDNPKQMVPTWTETGARLLVTRFLKSFIETGCIILLEEGGNYFHLPRNREEMLPQSFA